MLRKSVATEFPLDCTGMLQYYGPGIKRRTGSVLSKLIRLLNIFWCIVLMWWFLCMCMQGETTLHIS